MLFRKLKDLHVKQNLCQFGDFWMILKTWKQLSYILKRYISNQIGSKIAELAQIMPPKITRIIQQQDVTYVVQPIFGDFLKRVLRFSANGSGLLGWSRQQTG